MKRADIAVLSVLSERYGPMIYQRARQILGHEGDAEETLRRSTSGRSPAPTYILPNDVYTPGG